MASDFGRRTLPLDSGAYLQPSDTVLTGVSWRKVFDSANQVLNQCVRRGQDPLPGWNTVSSMASGTSRDEAPIIVAFWPRNSAMDTRYGPNADYASLIAGNQTQSGIDISAENVQTS